MIRRVPLAKPFLQRVARERRHCFRRAENRLGQRVRRPEILREKLVDQVFGIVLRHADFFEDHGLLARDVFIREFRVERHVREHVERVGQVLVEDARLKQTISLEVKASSMPPTRSISRAMSSAVRRARALEHHVLDEMRDAVELGRLAPRSVRSQMPTETERTCGICSVRTTSPFGSTSFCTVEVVFVM